MVNQGALKSGLGAGFKSAPTDYESVFVVRDNRGHLGLIWKVAGKGGIKLTFIRGTSKGVHATIIPSLKEFTVVVGIPARTVARGMGRGLVSQLCGYKNQRTQKILEDLTMAYLVDVENLKVVGRFASKEDISELGLKGTIINDVTDLELLSVAQLVLLFNSMAAPEAQVKKFKDSKDGAKQLLTLMDAQEDFAQLVEKKVAGKAKKEKAAKEPKEGTPRATQYADDDIIVRTNFSHGLRADSARGKSVALIPEATGITVKEFSEKVTEICDASYALSCFKKFGTAKVVKPTDAPAALKEYADGAAERAKAAKAKEEEAAAKAKEKEEKAAKAKKEKEEAAAKAKETKKEEKAAA